MTRSARSSSDTAASTARAEDYAASLLTRLREAGVPGLADVAVDVGPDVDALEAWARCGGMWLTGEAGGPPQPAPGDQAACLRGAAATAGALAERLGGRLDLDGPALVGERAALLGLSRRGTASCGGTTRLLPAADRWVAMALARDADVDALAAWLGREWRGEPWDAVERGLASMTAAEAVERAQLLGIPAAIAARPDEIADRAKPFRVRGHGGERVGRRPLVMDLSSLWAGPLCSRVLAAAGARVVKVESVARPDGTRSGPPAFFDLLHAGKESVALDFRTDAGRAALAGLLHAADVVVESSRPRALEQLGVHPERVLTRPEPLVWVGISGYGRTGPQREWVAFGDDAAVAGGIAALTGEPDGPPLFCADAYADPVTGLHAAVGALACLAGGGSWLIDLAMRDVVAHLLEDAPRVRLGSAGRVERRGEGWDAITPGGNVPVAPPAAPRPVGHGPALGEHTESVLSELGIAS